jgi:hypothetical protein
MATTCKENGFPFASMNINYTENIITKPVDSKEIQFLNRPSRSLSSTISETIVKILLKINLQTEPTCSKITLLQQILLLSPNRGKKVKLSL